VQKRFRPPQHRPTAVVVGQLVYEAAVRDAVKGLFHVEGDCVDFWSTVLAHLSNVLPKCVVHTTGKTDDWSLPATSLLLQRAATFSRFLLINRVVLISFINFSLHATYAHSILRKWDGFIKPSLRGRQKT
jgi:hypothetical protein